MNPKRNLTIKFSDLSPEQVKLLSELFSNTDAHTPRNLERVRKRTIFGKILAEIETLKVGDYRELFEYSGVLAEKFHTSVLNVLAVFYLLTDTDFTGASVVKLRPITEDFVKEHSYKNKGKKTSTKIFRDIWRRR